MNTAQIINAILVAMFIAILLHSIIDTRRKNDAIRMLKAAIRIKDQIIDGRDAKVAVPETPQPDALFKKGDVVIVRGQPMPMMTVMSVNQWPQTFKQKCVWQTYYKVLWFSGGSVSYAEFSEDLLDGLASE